MNLSRRVRKDSELMKRIFKTLLIIALYEPSKYVITGIIIKFTGMIQSIKHLWIMKQVNGGN